MLGKLHGCIYGSVGFESRTPNSVTSGWYINLPALPPISMYNLGPALGVAHSLEQLRAISATQNGDMRDSHRLDEVLFGFPAEASSAVGRRRASPPARDLQAKHKT